MIEQCDFLTRLEAPIDGISELTEEELDHVAGGNGITKKPPQFVELGYSDGSPYPYFDNLPYSDAPPPSLPYTQWV